MDKLLGERSSNPSTKYCLDETKPTKTTRKITKLTNENIIAGEELKILVSSLNYFLSRFLLFHLVSTSFGFKGFIKIQIFRGKVFQH